MNENHRKLLADDSHQVGGTQELDELPGHRFAKGGERRGGMDESDQKEGQEVLVPRGALHLPAEHTAEFRLPQNGRNLSILFGHDKSGAAYPKAMRNATRRIRAAALATFALGTLLVVVSARAGTLEIGPDGDLCRVLRQVEPGDEVVLQPGEYRAGCAMRRGGLPQAPVVIRAANPELPPRLTHPGPPASMLEIRASDVIVRGLAFGPTVPDADGVRIITGDRITVEDCQFSQMGGIAVVANHTSVRGLTVRRNVITQSNATAMYFGCHDGASCTVSGLLVEGNRISGVTAPNPEIGYGIEVKLNSSALIRDNVISGTKGPGIMVYGSRDLLTVSTVERNFLRGSRTSSGIVVGGGPVVVRNNISGWNAEAGIGLENYGRRGLLRGIAVTHNTVYGNSEGGIMVPTAGFLDAALRNNAGHGRAGAPAFPTARPGLRSTGNADCTWLQCFADPEGLDFSPFAGSLLRGLAQPRAMDGVPADDFFGAPRGIPPAIGAIERPARPIQLDGRL